MKNAMGPNCAAEWQEWIERFLPGPPLAFCPVVVCVQREETERARWSTARENSRTAQTFPQVRTIQEQVLLGRVALHVVPPFEVAAVRSSNSSLGGPAAKLLFFPALSPRGKRAWRGEPQEPPECKSPLSLA